MLILYKAPADKLYVQKPVPGMEIVHSLRRAAELKLVNYFVFWQFVIRTFSGKMFCIYAVIDNDKCIHHSHVIGKGWRFPFMEKADLEIGPCWTHPEYRNRGIYTAMIRRILSDFKNNRCWIICSEDNLASRKGIEKAGFKAVARGERTKPLGCRLIGRFVFPA